MQEKEINIYQKQIRDNKIKIQNLSLKQQSLMEEVAS